MKVVLSGGGTGGHVNPALNIAKAIKKQDPHAEISFVGTKRGIESTLVPKAGYEIDFVDVQGFRRKMNFKGLKENCKALYKAVASVRKAKKILKERQPDVVVGTGGYVSWPTVKAAAKLGIPCLIHEQNTFPGVTTKKLSKLANVVCVSFEGSEKYFPSEAAEKLYRFLSRARSPKELDAMLETGGEPPKEDAIRELTEAGLLQREAETQMRVKGKKIRMCSLSPEPPAVALTPKQQQVADALREFGTLSEKELCYICGVTSAVVTNLVKHGTVIRTETDPPQELPEAQSDAPEITLSGEQQAVYDRIAPCLEDDAPRCFLHIL